MKRAKGHKRKALRRKASRQRKKMIRRRRKAAKTPRRRRRNTGTPRESMNGNYRRFVGEIKGSAKGKKALARYRKFWGLPFPPDLQEIENDGKPGQRYLVGMGGSPVAVLSDKPMGEKGKVRKIKGSFVVATDENGKRIYLIRKRNKGKPIGKGLKFAGYAPETHYIPTDAMEKAGTFKKGAYWIHKHSDEGGKWPKVYKDSSGNYVYGPGTYRVGQWIRR